MSELKELTTNNFQSEVMDSSVPVLVDFWAPWCGPCRQVTPVVEAIAKERGDSLKVMKLNIDDNPQLAGQYGIMSIPTLILFRGGQVVKQVVGALPKTQLEQKLELG